MCGTKSTLLTVAAIVCIVVTCSACWAAGRGGGGFLWASVDMERLYFLGCTLYGYAPGAPYLLGDQESVDRHREALNSMRKQIDRLEQQKASIMDTHETAVRELIETRPDHYEEKLARLDTWLEDEVGAILEKLRPLRDKARRLEKHTQDDKADFTAAWNKAPDIVGTTVRRYVREAAAEAGAAVVINTASFFHGRPPRDSENLDFATLMRTPLNLQPKRESAPTGDQLVRWWNLRHTLYRKPYFPRQAVPFIAAGGTDLSLNVARKLLLTAAGGGEHGRTRWRLAQRPVGSAVPGAGRTNASASPAGIVATVDFDILLLFHPEMAEFIPAFGRFVRPFGTYLLGPQRQAAMEKRRRESGRLQEKALELEKRLSKNIERINIRIRNAQRRLHEGRIWAQRERDRIVANVPRASVIDMTAPGKQPGQRYQEKPLENEKLPDNIEERKRIAERRYWEITDQLEKEYQTIKERGETEIAENRKRIDGAFEKVKTVMYLTEDETHRRFKEIVDEIRSATGSTANAMGLAVVLNRTYRGARFYQADGASWLDRVTAPGDDLITEETALSRLLSLRRELIEEASRSSGHQDDAPPLEGEINSLTDSQLEEWFYKRQAIREARDTYVDTPMFLTGNVDITLEVLEALLADHDVDPAVVSHIMEFCRRRITTD